ncbi:DUF3231 family protein [Pseudalkalibacillus hwajinpoensis]|uniref:DUF3231 family protein n=1 Tax=Guptibacillus hwajinpoensis TaxID=208199 RepID=A0A4U1MLJ9_9BACL|nr:DUF3231 family protein [Pseudalkalibacillus hwajinpoensis]TKD72093.1 DUF3231 family protein [Pseudalkalibacillus hwajinpoensis]
MANKPKMSSTEIGALWMTYQKKTVILRMLEYFIEKSDDKKAKHLMEGLWKKLNPKVKQIEVIFQNEGAAVPIGFTSDDVFINASKLYDHGFDIMFMRVLKQISMAMYTLHLSMAYREDIVKLYMDLTALTQTYYNEFTQYLLTIGILPRPTYISAPESVEFITDKKYMKSSSLFGSKRALSTIEFAYLYHSIETNITGVQMITGFAQTAHDEKVRKYFLKGKELSKEIIIETGKILQQEDIQIPATPGGNVTTSQEAPFSDKLMMYCTYLLSNFGVGGQSFGAAFGLRNDLILKSGVFAKDVYEYAREGVELMIANNWMEEPPQMDHHDDLIT